MSGIEGQNTLGRALIEAVARMPDPMAAAGVEAFERELTGYFGVRHAVAVASGTASLETALTGAGIGEGDEVLVPALTVVMSVAPILAVGALPVFVDSDPDTLDLDYADAAAKVSERTRAVMPVHLWGRMGDPAALRAFASRHHLTIVEDAAQAVGTERGGERAGCVGDVGCFSTKDGKILWSGEGGFLLTANDELAAVARAYRTHWQTPPPGSAPLARIGANYRLAEPLAAIAAYNASRLPDLLAHRRAQTGQLADSLTKVPGLSVYQPAPDEAWNGYAPLARIELPNPRGFAEHLAAHGVPNSTGTYRLVACDTRPMFAGAPTCPNAARVIDTMFALVLTDHDTPERLAAMVETIQKEAAAWTG
jgi:perosamine synthetase